MPALWPENMPYMLLREGAERIKPETGMRTETDSGKARQRQQFTATDNGFAGNIPMSKAQVVAFEAWYDSLDGGTFTYPEHPFTDLPTEARFIVGRVGPARLDPAHPRWLYPVAIEFV